MSHIDDTARVAYIHVIKPGIGLGEPREREMRYTIAPAGSRYALAGSPNAASLIGVQITDALSATVETATQADALELARTRWPLAASWACYPHNGR